jgi:hypothetical protein
MNVIAPTNLEEAIRQSGEAWVIDWYDPPSEAMSHIRRILAEVDHRARARLGGDAPHLTESSLLMEYRRNPQRVKGFFQALGASRTPDMLLMAWRIVQGMEIKKIQLSYVRRQSFEVQVVLESPYGEEDEPYTSSDISDFTILRHFGTLEIDATPVFDGFYPMNVRG